MSIIDIIFIDEFWNYCPNDINEKSSNTYNIAIKFDKRNYFRYYVSLIRTQHYLIFTFFNNNDINSGIIKVDFFFILFTIEYIVNAVFYNNDTIHKIYEDKGEVDLINKLVIEVYPYLISTLLNYPLKFLDITNGLIINFTQDISKNGIKEKSKNIIKLITIKFILYFIISSLFLLFFGIIY